MSALLFLWFCLVPGPDQPLQPHVVSYIESHMYLAIDEMQLSGIPASITLAQAIIETNGGTSRLAREGNNHFGIKCKSYWKGETFYQPDDDRDANGKLIPSCFRVYDSVMDSYRDHTEFLMTSSNYRSLFQYEETDYESWARGLQLCGYATDPRYGEKLISTIRRYHLDELDYYVVQFIPKAKLDSVNHELRMTN